MVALISANTSVSCRRQSSARSLSAPASDRTPDAAVSPFQPRSIREPFNPRKINFSILERAPREFAALGQTQPFN